MSDIHSTPERSNDIPNSQELSREAQARVDACANEIIRACENTETMNLVVTRLSSMLGYVCSSPELAGQLLSDIYMERDATLSTIPVGDWKGRSHILDRCGRAISLITPRMIESSGNQAWENGFKTLVSNHNEAQMKIGEHFSNMLHNNTQSV